MKRRIKRKALLVSMAIAAGIPASAFAQGSGKAERNGYHYSMAGRNAHGSAPVDVIQEDPEMRIDSGSEGIRSGLLDAFKGMIGNLGARTEAAAGDQRSAWKLELSNGEQTTSKSTDHPRISAGKPVGMALRLKF